MKELSKINAYLWRYKWRLILGFIFVAAQNYFRILIPPQFRKALDSAIASLNAYRDTTDAVEKEAIINAVTSELMYYALFVIGFALMMGFFMFMMRQTVIVVSRLIEYDFRKDIFHHYEKLDSSFYGKNTTGDMMSRITEDVSKVRMYLGPGILYCINLITLFVLAIYYMYNVNPKLTLYALAPMPFLSVSIYWVSSYIHKRSEIIQIQLAKLTTISQEVYSGIRVIKSYVKEGQFQKYFQKETNDYKNKSMDLAKVNALFHPLMMLLVSGSILLVVLVGGIEVSKGNITHGNIAEFIIYVTMLTWPFTAIGWIVSIVQQAEASQKRINQFLDTEPKIVNTVSENMQIKGQIAFDKATFVYADSGIKALDKVSFDVKKGEKLGIIGRTASGKTTIANLMLRMNEVTDGAILIDGVNINDINLHDLRQSIGYVPQDSFLFSDSISNNVAFGKPNTSQDEISQITKSSAVYEDIMNLPKQFDTVIGERGVTLSGGQKQRISIARALVKNPNIIILDDCLSAVDTTTEQLILGHLNNELKEKTCLIITHRIYKHLTFDKIIVLDEGKLVEYGSPEELIKKEGFYYDLLQKQQYEEKIIEN
ncbi:MAG: ABC transporter ATP-binding protein [Saprospiraceae bacterium]